MYATLLSSWSAITKPKTTIVSGRTIRIRPRPNSSGFSAIAPTVAPPTTFSAHAVAIPVPAMVIAADNAAKGSAMCLYLRCRSRTKGSERRSVSLEELDEGFDVVQTQGLNPCGDPAEQADEELGEDEEDDAQDQETDRAGADQAGQGARVDRPKRQRNQPSLASAYFLLCPSSLTNPNTYPAPRWRAANRRERYIMSLMSNPL